MRAYKKRRVLWGFWCLQVAKALLLRYHPMSTALTDKVKPLLSVLLLPAQTLCPMKWNWNPIFSVTEALLPAWRRPPGSDGGRRILLAHERLSRRPEPRLSCRRSHHVPPALLQRKFGQVGPGLQHGVGRYSALIGRLLVLQTVHLLTDCVCDLEVLDRFILIHRLSPHREEAKLPEGPVKHRQQTAQAGSSHWATSGEYAALRLVRH